MPSDLNRFRSLAESYFAHFHQGELSGLRELFAPEITLTDWTGHWQGREAVLATNAAILENKPAVDVLEIVATPLALAPGGRTYCKIQVRIGDQTLKVLDVIDWTPDGKITALEAFLG